MKKAWIRFRKKWILPFRWSRMQLEDADTFDFPPTLKLVEKKRLIDEEMVAAERVDNKTRISYLNGQLDLLNWIRHL